MQVWRFVASVLLLSACSPPATEQAAESPDALADNIEMQADNLEQLANASQPAREPDTAWVYQSSEDKMRGGANRTASVDANAPIRLDFPYGESTPSLNVRQDAKYGFDIYLAANGQFLCRSYNDDTLSVKFDNRPITEWACAEADGGSNDIVFIRRGKAFLSEIKRSKEVTIEVAMYEAGRQQMTFNVAGLKW